MDFGIAPAVITAAGGRMTETGYSADPQPSTQKLVSVLISRFRE